MNLHSANTRNFTHLIKTVKMMAEAGWVPHHPDSAEAKKVGFFLDLRENQVMSLQTEPDLDLFPVREENGVRRLPRAGGTRWCFVDLAGKATIITTKQSEPRVIKSYRGRLKLRLTRNEYKWASKFSSRLRRGWRWDPWLHTVIDPKTLTQADEREVFDSIPKAVLADLFPELASLLKNKEVSK